MYEIAECGCEVDIESYVGGEGCCDYCYSEVVVIESVRIVNACSQHGG